MELFKEFLLAVKEVLRMIKMVFADEPAPAPVLMVPVTKKQRKPRAKKQAPAPVVFIDDVEYAPRFNIKPQDIPM